MTAAGHMRIGLYALAMLVLTGCERCQDDVALRYAGLFACSHAIYP